MANVVFWSGGEDSTLVAIRLLRAGEHVKLISIDNSLIGGARQQNLEAISRKRALAKMEKEFGKHKITAKSVVFDADFRGTNAQADIFAGIFPMLCDDKDVAHYGIIETDTFWHVRHKVEAVFKAVCELCDIKVELKFPLEWYSKKQVRAELKKYGYLEYTIHSGDKL